MATFSQSASVKDVLESIRSELVSVVGINDEYVRLVASDEYDYIFEDKFIAIRPFGPDPSTDHGGGRGCRPEKRVIRVYANIRSSLDTVGNDIVALNALIALENQINDALDEFQPLSDDDVPVPLTIEALHPISSVEYPPKRKPKDDIGQLFSALHYEIVYVRPNSIPAP